MCARVCVCKTHRPMCVCACACVYVWLPLPCVGVCFGRFIAYSVSCAWLRQVQKGVDVDSTDQSGIAAAIAAVQWADVVVLAVGIDTITVEHETVDRVNISLPGLQVRQGPLSHHCRWWWTWTVLMIDCVDGACCLTVVAAESIRGPGVRGREADHADCGKRRRGGDRRPDPARQCHRGGVLPRREGTCVHGLFTCVWLMLGLWVRTPPSWARVAVVAGEFPALLSWRSLSLTRCRAVRCRVLRVLRRLCLVPPTASVECQSLSIPATMSTRCGFRTRRCRRSSDLLQRSCVYGRCAWSESGGHERHESGGWSGPIVPVLHQDAAVPLW